MNTIHPIFEPIIEAIRPQPIKPRSFVTWTFAGKRFLAFPQSLNPGASTVVTDEEGTNYGSWFSVESFRERQQKGDGLAQPLNGTVFLQYLILGDK